MLIFSLAWALGIYGQIMVNLQPKRYKLASKRTPFELASVQDTGRGSLFSLQGNVSFGSPPQLLRIMFDTGSFHFFVRDAQCKSKCEGLPIYDMKLSSTYSGPGEKISPITYADGTSIGGNKATDTVSIGGLQVNNQDFIQASIFNSIMSDQDGIMGMAIKSPDQRMFHQNLYESKAISVPIFSRYLFNDDLNGVMIFGAVDKSRYAGSLLWIPVLRLRLIL